MECSGCGGGDGGGDGGWIAVDVVVVMVDGDGGWSAVGVVVVMVDGVQWMWWW